jgi:hypothetical protein
MGTFTGCIESVPKKAVCGRHRVCTQQRHGDAGTRGRRAKTPVISCIAVSLRRHLWTDKGAIS